MATFLAGARLTAQTLNDAFTDTGTDTQSTGGTTTSGSYVETLTSGTPCSFTFTAPTSGKVMVLNTTQIDNSSSAQTSLMSFVIRTGSTIGSGTTFFAATDDDCVRNLGTNEIQVTHATEITGLTAGQVYNIRQAFRGSGGATATFTRKRLQVIPLAA